MIELNNGRKIEGVTAAVIEQGKMKITHAGGISRIGLEEITPYSQRAIGIPMKEVKATGVPECTWIETLDGKVYEDVRALRVKPSFISFIHKNGASSVRFENLSEEFRKSCGYSAETAKQFDRERAEAEWATAKAEDDLSRAESQAAMKAEARQMRDDAIQSLQYMNYGSNSYWSGDSRTRQLQDAAAAAYLRKAGVPVGQINGYINGVKFR